MRGNTIKGRTLENPVPLMRERAKDWAVSQAGEDIIPVGIGMALFEIFQYGQPHRTDRIALFGFSQPQATSVEIDFIPPQTNDLAAATSRQRQKRSEEHTSELQSLMRISYAVFCLNKKNNKQNHT